METPKDVDKKKEVERFKRRMIRVVARQMLHEKKPEEEMWKDLRKETGYDCELVWLRMRSITAKKLRRMLAAEDRVDEIAKPARMTVTDWLLFDLVLVHEKIDVIGVEGARVKSGELKPLTDLFSLVQKYEIEEACASPQRLAEAWTNATLFYNSQGHHVSPMLLQKRWYQLKESTRDCFYKFWFSYRGNAKQFTNAMALHMPSMLQMAIARRFKEVITCSFMEWEEMIQLGLVILSDEFEARMRPSSKQVDENVPDIEVIEPVIETIDLEADGAPETYEHKRNTAPQAIVKTEPIDNDEVQHITDADLLEDTFIPQEDTDTFDAEFDEMETEENLVDNELVENIPIDSENIASDANNDIITTSDVQNDGVIPTLVENITDNPSVNNADSIKDLTADTVINNDINEPTAVIKQEPSEHIVEIDKLESAKDHTVNDNNIEPFGTLPQITSVFGNVDITSPNISTINDLSLSTENIGTNNSVPETPEVMNELIKEGLNPDLITHVHIKQEDTKMDEHPSIEQMIDKTCEKALELVVNEDIKELKSDDGESKFGELPCEFKLSDDDIELVDDGIAYVDDDLAFDSKIESVKIEMPESEDSEGEEDAMEKNAEESPKIDLKLLLYPVVYTAKLDIMGIENFETVHGKELLDTICIKSKPISKKTMDLNKVQKECEPCASAGGDDVTGEHAVITDSIVDENKTVGDHISDNTNDYDDEEDIISNDRRVKLSSYLLQKPRTRTYNPIVLCKNPDFNTRLKRLNVGFFSSQRNMGLLKHCKPLTIDVSKAFESKLINGTIYIKRSEEDVSNDNKVVHASESQQVSVIPSAMPVQSLINIQKMNPLYTTPNVHQSQTYDDNLMVERNKVINLPDISQVRRLNQRLLTAEVSPIQIQNTLPPVSIVKPLVATKQHDVDNYDDAVSSRKIVVKNTPSTSAVEDLKLKDGTSVVDSNKEDTCKTSSINSYNTLETDKPRFYYVTDTKKKQPYSPWKPRELRPKVTWVSKHVNTVTDDILLTVDTLNKMLYLLSQEKGEQKELVNKPSKVLIRTSKKELTKKRKILQQTKDTCTQDDSNNEEVQIVSGLNEEQQLKNKPNVKPKVTILKTAPKGSKISCCWAKDMLKFQKTKRKRTLMTHSCPEDSCQCCCRIALTKRNDVNTNKSLAQACETIESVVQQTYSETEIAAKVTTVTRPKLQKAVVVDAATDCEGLNTESTVDTTTEDCTVEHTPTIGAEVSVLSKDASSNKAEVKSSELAPTIILPKRSPPNPKIPIPLLLQTKGTKGLRLNSSNDRRVVYRPTTVTTSRITVPSTTNLCNCTPQVSVAVNRPQRRIVIDGSGTCQVHNKMAPRIMPKEKQIYLTSRQLLQKPSKSPIFLGKNKVLLTNIKFPSGLHAEIAVQQRPVVKIMPTLPLPAGVQLVLLDNGELTYTVDPNVQLDVEQLESLPGIINAVKLQLNTDQLGLTNNMIEAANVPQNNEVVTLSDDDTPQSVNECSMISKASDESTKKEAIENTSNDVTRHTAQDAVVNIPKDFTENSPNVINKNVTNNMGPTDASASEGIEETNNLQKACLKSQSTEVQHTVESMDQRSDITDKSNANENTVDVPIEIDTGDDKEQAIPTNLGSNDKNKTQIGTKDIDSNSQNASHNYNLITENVIEENKDLDATKTSDPTSEVANESVTDKNGKGKNILSDLMEMSGISAEDASPVQNNLQPPEKSALEHYLTTEGVQATVRLPSVGNVGNIPLNLSEFSTITSFAELKYACAHNGLFFKLDFETGIIIPINVCIKKQTPPDTARSPLTETIDLTEDVEEVSVNRTPKPHSTSAVMVASRRSISVLKSGGTGVVKPLKMFKSMYKNVGQTNKKNIYLTKKTYTTENVPTRQKGSRGRLRKQISEIQAKIDMVDSDCPMEEEYLDTSDHEKEPRKRLSDENSSDEEPLSKVAKKMRGGDDGEKNMAEPNVEQRESSPPPDAGEPENISFMLGQSDEDADDDCILGV